MTFYFHRRDSLSFERFNKFVAVEKTDEMRYRRKILNEIVGLTLL